MSQSGYQYSSYKSPQSQKAIDRTQMRSTALSSKLTRTIKQLEMKEKIEKETRDSRLRDPNGSNITRTKIVSFEEIAAPKKVARDVLYLENINSELRTELDALRRHAGMLHNQIKDLTTLVDTKNSEKDDLVNQIKAEQSETSILRSEVRNLTQELETKNFSERRNKDLYISEINDLKTKLHQSENTTSKDDVLIDDLREEVRLLAKENEELKFENKRFAANHSGVDLENRDLHVENANLRIRLEEATAQARLDQSDIEANLDLFEKTKNDYEKVFNKLKDLESLCDTLTRENNKLRADLARK